MPELFRSGMQKEVKAVRRKENHVQVSPQNGPDNHQDGQDSHQDGQGSCQYSQDSLKNGQNSDKNGQKTNQDVQDTECLKKRMKRITIFYA